MTIREWLTTNFGDSAPKQIVNEYGDRVLNQEVTPRLCSSEGGALQGWCGGTCIIGFRPINSAQRSVYLVIDDTSALAWDAEMKEKPYQILKPRPHQVLRLVVAA